MERGRAFCVVSSDRHEEACKRFQWGAPGIGSIIARDVRHLLPLPSRSRAKMAHIPGGALFGLRRLVRVTELHQQRPIFLSAEAAVGKYEQMTFYCNKKDIRFFVKYITLQPEKCMVKKAENQWGE